MKLDGLPIDADEAEEVIKQLVSYDSTNLGIFISKLSYVYIKTHKMTKEQFIKSLSNSIEKLEQEDN